MGVAAILTRVAAIQKLVAGVGKAFDGNQAVSRIEQMDLPAFMTLIGSESVDLDESVALLTLPDDEDGELWQGTLQLVMRLYVKPLATGITGEVIAACVPFLDAVPEVFIARPLLVEEPTYADPPAGLLRARYQGHGGVVSRPMPGSEQPCAALEFKLAVAIERQIALADGN